MIRPLRRRHRRMISWSFLLLLTAGLLAFLRPPPSSRVDALPPAVLAAEGASDSR